MKKLIFSLIFGLGVSSFAQGLPAEFLKADGKTFSAMGPNCFSTALRLNGLTRSYRGLDGEEFNQIVKLFCQRTQDPRLGDLGVFETPGFGFLHAYAYVSPEMGMQKPGVDYNGKTAIRMYSTYSIDYVYTASAECRRYAPDISVCSNDHYYLRCEAVNMMGNPAAEKHDQIIRPIEAAMDAILENPNFGSTEQKLLEQIIRSLPAAKLNLSQHEAEIPADLRRYLQARIKSLEDQLEFLVDKFG